MLDAVTCNCFFQPRTHDMRVVLARNSGYWLVASAGCRACTTWLLLGVADIGYCTSACHLEASSYLLGDFGRWVALSASGSMSCEHVRTTSCVMLNQSPSCTMKTSETKTFIQLEQLLYWSFKDPTKYVCTNLFLKSRSQELSLEIESSRSSFSQAPIGRLAQLEDPLTSRLATKRNILHHDILRSDLISIVGDGEVEAGAVGNHGDSELQIVVNLAQGVGEGWERFEVDLLVPGDTAKCLGARVRTLRCDS